MIELTRRYGFPAAHILSQPSFSEAENWATYGKCANPNGHGHNYGVEVTLTGQSTSEPVGLFRRICSIGSSRSASSRASREGC